jgi:hypothetical protein
MLESCKYFMYIEDGIGYKLILDQEIYISLF